MALAPTVILDNCGEQSLIDYANAEDLSSNIQSMNFLEYNGKDRNKPDELKEYMWKEYLFLCAANPDLCNFKIGIHTPEDIDASESADLRRVDMSRIQVFINGKGGSSIKNIIHMGQIMNYKRFADYNYNTSKG